MKRRTSPTLQSRCDLHLASKTSSCVTISPSFDCWQTRPHVFHRPFETVSSSVGRSEADTDTDVQPSPAVSGCQADDDRHDVTSWADCLRQLATSLRRRRVTDDSGLVAVQIPADVGSLDQRTTGNQRSPDCEHRHHHHHHHHYDDGDADVVKHDQLQSVDNEEHRSSSSSSSSSNDNNNLPVSKFDTPTTEYTRSVNDLYYSLSFNAAIQGHSCRSLNWLTHTHTHTHRDTSFFSSDSAIFGVLRYRRRVYNVSKHYA